MATITAASLPQGRRGRVLALFITTAGLALLWLAVAQPLLDAHAAAATALARRQTLALRMAGLADSLPKLRQAAAALRAQPAAAEAVVAGGTDAVAEATLQGDMEAMAARAGARLSSAEALPAEPAGAYRRLALRVTVDATWPMLVGLLQAAEQATPRMFIDDLQLHALPGALLPRLAGTARPTREPSLDISFTLLAFRAADPATAARTGAGSP